MNQMQLFVTILFLFFLQGNGHSQAGPVAHSINPSSEWAKNSNSSMRLIAAPPFNRGQVFRAGIEIVLHNNFKTYWRTPGESGVAPQISFEGSLNLEKATIMFPAPTLFKDAAGTTIGYKEHVIWPIRIVPKDASEPVFLKVKLDYGICEHICIPVSSRAELSVSAQTSFEFDKDLAVFEDRVPQAGKVGDNKNLSISFVTEPVPDEKHKSFFVDLKTNTYGTIINTAQLLAEGQPDSWFLDVSDPLNLADGQTRYKITVFDPEKQRNGVPCNVRLTAMTAKEAIEVPVHLAGCIEKP